MHRQVVDERIPAAARIAEVYLRATGGDAWAALVHAVADALNDLAEAERRRLRRDRLISRGYVRGGGFTPDERP